MDLYDSNCTSQPNWVDVIGIHGRVFVPELLYAIVNIDAELAVTFKVEPLEVYFREQPDVPFPWNIHWADAAREGRGLDNNDQVLGQH
jgi:hypothetical protein